MALNDLFSFNYFGILARYLTHLMDSMIDAYISGSEASDEKCDK